MSDQRRAIVPENTGSLPTCIECIRQAINGHNVDALAACFDPNYQSEFPVHPERAFRGHSQMRTNWTQMFNAVPDITAAVLRWVVDRDTAWAEWEWTGTGPGGRPFLWRGVSILGVGPERTTWVRMYMEPVQPGGHAIAGADQRGQP